MMEVWKVPAFALTKSLQMRCVRSPFPAATYLVEGVSVRLNTVHGFYPYFFYE